MKNLLQSHQIQVQSRILPPIGICCCSPEIAKELGLTQSDLSDHAAPVLGDTLWNTSRDEKDTSESPYREKHYNGDMDYPLVNIQKTMENHHF